MKVEFLNKVLESYKNSFDIYRDDPDYDAKAFFHSRGAKYILVKKAKIWATETNEYSYFVLTEIENKDDFFCFAEKILIDGMKEIVPHDEHMSSTISFVIINNSISDDVISAIKKYKKYKAFKLTLHGWMDFKVVAIDLSKKAIYTNKKGEDMVAIYEKLLF